MYLATPEKKYTVNPQVVVTAETNIRPVFAATPDNPLVGTENEGSHKTPFLKRKRDKLDSKIQQVTSSISRVLKVTP